MKVIDNKRRPRLSNANALWRRWRARLGIFVTGQVSVQLLGFFSGLMVLRWMSQDEYAKTGVVLGFQSVFSAAVDLGICGSLVALIGSRGDRPEIVGAYVAAARWWRRALMIVVLPVGATAFYFINVRQGWPWHEAVVLYVCIAVSLYFAGMVAWASAPLLMHQRLRSLYAGSNAAALGRLLGCAALHQAGMLDAVNVTLLGTLVSGCTAWMYWRAARQYLVDPGNSSADVRAEIRRYVAPLVPLALFYALQGQLGTLLISVFGKAQDIAEVTALGRLAQLFGLLSAAFGTLLLPYFARLDQSQLKRRYSQTLACTFGLAIAISSAAFAFPEPLLWVLGKHYDHLVDEVGWLVLGSAISFASGGIWFVHAARKWVFWRGTLFYVVTVSVTQLVFVAYVNLSSTLNVLYMGVATGTAALLCQVLIAFLGFRFEKAKSAVSKASDERPLAVSPTST